MRGDRPSRTAEGVAWLRAGAGTDPFARAFLGPVARIGLPAWRLVRALDALAVGDAVLARHAAIDEAVAASEAGQVVLLGAGYDARPWRLARPGVRWYLVDHPATAARRARRAAALPPVDAVRVDVDFATERFTAQLVAAGFDAGRPACFVWEGVSMYLDAPVVAATLADIRGLCAPGSTLAMDFWTGQGSIAERMGRFAVALVGEPLRYAPTMAEAEALVRAAGFPEVRWVASAAGHDLRVLVARG